MKKKILLGIGIIAVCAALYLIVTAKKFEVFIADVTKGDIEDEITLSGHAEPVNLKRYFFPFAEGTMLAVKNVGTKIKKGGALFSVHSKEAEALYHSSKLAYEAAKLKLDNLTIALNNMKRQLELGIVPEDEYNISRNNRDIASKELEAARLDHERSAELYREICPAADFDGYVLDMAFTKGQRIYKGDYIMAFGDPGEMIAEIFLNEFDRNKIKELMRIEVRFDYLERAVFRGELIDVADISIIDQFGANLYRARIRINEPDAGILLNSKCEVKCFLNSYRDKYLMPAQALISKDGEHFVWGVKGRRAYLIPVELNGIVKGNAVLNTFAYEHVITDPFSIKTGKKRITVKKRKKSEGLGLF